MADSMLSRAFAVEHPRQVWLITIAHGVNEFYSVALPPILPLLVADFNISYGKAGALVTVFFVMYSVFQLPAGFLADRIGQTKLLSGGMVLLSVGLFVVATGDNYLWLLVGQALAGIGGSTYHPSGMSLISDLEVSTTEGRAMGIHGFGGVTGMALSPVLIGGLASLYDWRVALTVGALVGVVYGLLFLVLFSLPDGVEQTGAESAESADTPDGIRDRIRALVAIPVAGWVLGLFAISFLVSFEVGAVRTFAPTYLFTRLSDSTLGANVIYFVMLVGAGIASLGAGNLADRIDRTAAGAFIFGLSAILLGATMFIPANAGVMLAWFFVLGLVIYAVSPMKNALTSSYSEQEFSGSLFGLMLTASSIGGALSPFVLGVVAERVGWEVAFPAIGLFALAGTVVFLTFSRKRFSRALTSTRTRSE